jgi:hypothetical protein
MTNNTQEREAFEAIAKGNYLLNWHEQLGYTNQLTQAAFWGFKQTARATSAPDGDVGETSDGYHTFNELYEHRHTLFIALCAVYPSWKSRLHADGGALPGWFIAGITTPEGEATYHLPDRLWGTLKAKELSHAPKWDGHTSNEVLVRIAALPALSVVGENEAVEIAHKYACILPHEQRAKYLEGYIDCIRKQPRWLNYLIYCFGKIEP